MAGDYVGDAVDDMIARVSGGDEELGYELGYEMGAMDDAEIGRKVKKHLAKKGHLKAMGSPVMMRSTREIWKRAPLGLGTYSLAAAAVTTLTGTVQRPFQPDRLLITSSALGIVVTSIKVGDDEQVLNGNVPAELYGTNAINDSLPDNFSPGATAITFSVSLSNTTAATTITGAVGFKGAVKR